jgi:hypothetical protein
MHFGGDKTADYANTWRTALCLPTNLTLAGYRNSQQTHLRFSAPDTENSFVVYAPEHKQNENELFRKEVRVGLESCGRNDEISCEQQ